MFLFALFQALSDKLFRQGEGSIQFGIGVGLLEYVQQIPPICVVDGDEIAHDFANLI